MQRIEAAPPSVLILGGSQGAQGLNAAILEMWKLQPQFFAGWNVVHQTGVAQCPAVQHEYQMLARPAEVAPFFYDMDQRYQAATLIISRAGATTLAELACTGVPAILVPYPSAADNHQWYNAQAFEEAGAARTCLQKETPIETARELIQQLTGVADDQQRRAEMSEAMRSLAQPKATQQVIEALDQAIMK